jgi:hypothetical protein
LGGGRNKKRPREGNKGSGKDDLKRIYCQVNGIT